MSKVICGLEKELGKKLFERTSKGIRLTPYGETVRDYARDILRNVLMINSIAGKHGSWERFREMRNGSATIPMRNGITIPSMWGEDLPMSIM